MLTGFCLMFVTVTCHRPSWPVATRPFLAHAH